ncbi:MAG: restriction endonuclease [Isosphaeraceae bacterium]
MAADPIIYCLEHLTDYDQFERLCHDLMALDGYRNIEPLGGSKDKGRDAIHIDSSSGTVTIFAYSVRDDWRTKLDEDSQKIQRHGHTCHQLAFLCTATFTPSERDQSIKHIKNTCGWPLELYGLERLSNMLRSTHRQLVAQHPQIFCPPFFLFAGGLSLSFSPDHLVIDHVDADAGLAHWLARRLTLAGYHVWCRGLAPLAGSSPTETIRGLLGNRAFRYICVLSPESVADPDFTSRRSIAQAIGMQRGEMITIPAVARPIDANALDHETRRLTAARFHLWWAVGLRDIEEVLSSANCPRKPEGARDLAIRSYFPGEIVLNEPELLASNLFRVAKFPEAVLRFYSTKPLDDEDGPVAGKWGFRKVGPTHFLSFHHPPAELVRDLGMTEKGGAVWNTLTEMDGIRVDDLITELIKKSLYAECRRRGLLYCSERRLVFFPVGLLKNDNLRFQRLDSSSTYFGVTGERTHGRGDRAKKYRYHIAPVFVPKGAPGSGYEIIVRIRLHITDQAGKQYSGRAAHVRRKKLCKSWWNEEWLARTMGVMQFLADGSEQIAIGANDSERIMIEPLPRTWTAPVRLNEEALGDTRSIVEEEIILPSDDEDEEEDESND